jgi:hypothetical protein
MKALPETRGPADTCIVAQTLDGAPFSTEHGTSPADLCAALAFGLKHMSAAPFTTELGTSPADLCVCAALAAGRPAQQGCRGRKASTSGSDGAGREQSFLQPKVHDMMQGCEHDAITTGSDGAGRVQSY